MRLLLTILTISLLLIATPCQADWTFLDTSIQKGYGSTSGGWVDMDISGDVPVGTNAIILRAVWGGASGVAWQARPNGSSDAVIGGVNYANQHYWYVGLDANRVFEYYSSHVDMDPRIVAYTTDDYDIDSSVDMGIGTTGSWQNADASGSIPAGASGVWWQIENGQGAGTTQGIQGGGSTWDMTHNPYSVNAPAGAIGVDGSGIFEAYISDTDIDVYVRGYTLTEAVYLLPEIDISLTSYAAWTDIDVSAYVSADAVGAIVLVETTQGGNPDYSAGLREEGSTETRNNNMQQNHFFVAPVGLDSNKIFEGYAGATAIDHYLIGYIKPAASGNPVSDYTILRGLKARGLNAR